jgi:hypothetical protein
VLRASSAVGKQPAAVDVRQLVGQPHAHEIEDRAVDVDLDAREVNRRRCRAAPEVDPELERRSFGIRCQPIDDA